MPSVTEAVSLVGAGGGWTATPTTGMGRSFDGGYWALLRWARREGLLTSWLNEKWAQSEHGVRSGVLTHVRPPDYSVPDDWGGFDEGARARSWAEFRANIWERDQIDTLVELRNLIVHSEPGRVVMPVDSARSLVSVAQFINHLWPAPESIGRPNPHV